MIPAIDVSSTSTSVSNNNTDDNKNPKEDEFDEEVENYCFNNTNCSGNEINLPRLIEKSVIIHRDENGFGLRVKGQAPVYVEHVHENGAAWRAGVRKSDTISKVNGTPVINMDHKDVVLMFKSCTRFVGLSLVSSVVAETASIDTALQCHYLNRHPSNNSSIISRSSYGTRNSQATLIGSRPFTLSLVGNSSQQQQLHQHHTGFGPTLSQPRLSDILLSDRPHYRQASTSIGNNRSCNSSIRATHHKLSVAGKHPALFPTNSTQSCSLLPMPQQQFANGSTTTSNPAAAISMQISSTYTRQSPYDKQQVARRSESVSVRPSYLSGPQQQQQQQQISAAGLSQQQLQHQRLLATRALERRTSFIEPGKSESELADRQQLNNKRMAICINCRSPIRQELQGSSSSSSSLNLTCVRCQLKFEPTQVEWVRGGGKQQGEPASGVQGPYQYKLNQSASVSSFPIDSSSSSPSKGGPNIVISSSGNTSKPPMTNKRLEIIREFIDTEKTHTDRLRCLDELFYRPLKTGGFMTAEQLRMVFSCHRTLYKIHRQIYRILLSANYNLYSEPMVGSALLEIFEGDLKRRLERAACTFCSSQSINAELLNKLTRRETKTGEFLAQVTSQQMVGRLGIKDLLASCFQRLTKYPLLLENLLKATPQSVLPNPATNESIGRTRVPKQRHHHHHQHHRDNYNDCETPPPPPGFDTETSDKETEEEYEEEEVEEEPEVRNSRRMLAISLAEEREFIERALHQSRQILVRVNESVKVAISHNKLKEIWKRTDKYPGVPLIDITKQQVVHEGLLTLRLSKRSFDVYVLLLNDYIIILTREGQDKYRLKFFTPEGKSSSTNSQSVYSPVFVIDEHLTTRDAATDENGFYLLCKRKDDSRIYEFASRSPAERLKWRDRIQWTIERQMSKGDRRASCESTITKSSSEISARQEVDDPGNNADIRASQPVPSSSGGEITNQSPQATVHSLQSSKSGGDSLSTKDTNTNSPDRNSSEPTKIEGTISYVEDDEIVMPSKMESTRPLVDQAIQVNIFDTVRKPVPSN